MEHRSTTDNFLGDPSIGIPTVMPYGGYGVLAHHNSGDVPETVDPHRPRLPEERRVAAAAALTTAAPELPPGNHKFSTVREQPDPESASDTQSLWDCRLLSNQNVRSHSRHSPVFR